LILALAIACIFSDFPKRLKVLASVAVLCAFGYNLVLAGRTMIVLMLLTGVLAFLAYSYHKKNDLFVIALWMAAIILVIYLIYANNVFHVRTWVEESELYGRFFGEYSSGITDDSRMNNKKIFLSEMFSYPFGGLHLRELADGYAHDILLDTYDEGSIFSLIPMLLYLLTSLSRSLRFVRDRRNPFNVRQCVFCIYAIVFMEFAIEPILQGYGGFFASFCFIDGCVAGVLYSLPDVTVKKSRVRTVVPC